MTPEPAPGIAPVAASLPDLIDARQAMATLGIKPQTLYAYVSRGLIRSVMPERRKVSLYYREDIEALQMRGRTRQASDRVAFRALRAGGGAVLNSSLTEITPQGPRYRGHLASELIEAGCTFEAAAELLWNGTLPSRQPTWPAVPAREDHDAFMRLLATSAPRNNSRRLLTLAVEGWASSLGGEAGAEQDAATQARALLQVLAGAVGLIGPGGRHAHLPGGAPLAAGLAHAMSLRPDAVTVRALDAALLVCADHELAPATFAARIAASVGADLYACISSALGAFEGLFTGYGCDAAEQLLRDAPSVDAYVDTLAGCAKRKEPLPGYDHPLYPRGDPRGLLLVEMAQRLAADAPAAQRACAAVQAVHERIGAQPSLTVGLAVLGISLGQPTGTPGAVMALGRCAGWVAHVLEQRRAGFLVRPRARYVAEGGDR